VAVIMPVIVMRVIVASMFMRMMRGGQVATEPSFPEV